LIAREKTTKIEIGMEKVKKATAAIVLAVIIVLPLLLAGIVCCV
jgi:hypothetical protein